MDQFTNFFKIINPEINFKINLDLLNFINIIINNYQNINPGDIINSGILKNIILFNKLKLYINTDSDPENILINKIIINPEYYQFIKNLLLDYLDINSEQASIIKNLFVDLEKSGFNNFGPFDKLSPELQEKITNNNLLTKNKYKLKYFGSEDPILNTRGSKYIINYSLVDTIKSFNISNFLPLDIIKSWPDNITDFNIYSGNKFIKKCYIISHDNNLNNLKFLDKICSIILKSILEYLEKYTKINIPQINNINILFYLSPAKKYFPDNPGQILNQTNLNSGYSSFSRIVIYRSEELVKVLIHELVHQSQLEKIIPGNIKNIFKFDINFSESLVEFFAELINCIIYSHIQNKNLELIIKQEIFFGLIQTAKILNYFGYNSMEDFIKNPDIKQTVPAFEYHILKTGLLSQINQVFNILINNPNQADLFNLAISGITNPDFINIINKIIKNINNMGFDLKKTFRMTITEIKLNYNNYFGGNLYKYNKYKKKYLFLKNKLINFKSG